MDNYLLQAIAGSLFLSLISLIGVVTLVFKKDLVNKLSMFLVAFSAGALLGGAFLHLLPEAVEIDEGLSPFIYLLVGISVFFVLEKYLKWHHCHKDSGECEVHTFTYMSLIGDGFHNFLDGLVIVSSFAVSTELGIITTLVVALHEIPQELGDFGILIHGGFSRKRALTWNFISSLTAILGVLVGYFMINSFENITALLLPFAAGGFVYISMSDLVPELHKENKIKKSLTNLFLFGFGIALMLVLKMFFGH